MEDTTFFMQDYIFNQALKMIHYVKKFILMLDIFLSIFLSFLNAHLQKERKNLF